MNSDVVELHGHRLSTIYTLWSEHFRQLSTVCYLGIGGLIALAQVVPSDRYVGLGISALAFIAAAIVSANGENRTLKAAEEWAHIPQGVRRFSEVVYGLLLLGIAAAALGTNATLW